MKKIDAYETTDGGVHKAHAIAVKIQAELDLKEAIETFVENTCWSGMLSSDVSAIMFDNIDELRKAIQ